MDLFEENLTRVENRLAQLIPPPVRKIPILIGGMWVRRTLPTVALFATEIHPTEAGYDFTDLEDMIRWRDQMR